MEDFERFILFLFKSRKKTSNQFLSPRHQSENSNSTHLALKRIERRISGMFRCEVKSRKTIERTKVERKFVFGK